MLAILLEHFSKNLLEFDMDTSRDLLVLVFLNNVISLLHQFIQCYTKNTKKHYYLYNNEITWRQNFHVVFVLKLLQQITILSVVASVTYRFV